jgi:phospholipid/cholesterol/gamma-HCH transport system substrate-binding protein
LTAARGIALSAIVVAVLLAGYLLLFSSGSGQEYTLVFQTAGQLVKDDDVQVAGRRIGSVRSIELTDDNLAAVKIKVEEPYAPLHEGTTGIIRLTSLSGIANRYVALTLGPDNARQLPEGATLDLSKTTSVVDLDQLFNALDEKTRGSLQGVIKGFATQYEGKSKEVSQSAKYFNPLLSTSRVLADQLTEDQGALTRFIVESSRAVTALAERRGDLSGLVTNANQTAGAIASENVALNRALELLPTTLRRANTTFVNLRATLDDLDVLVAESKPATKDLAPFLRQLRPLVRDARPTIHDLRLLIRRSGPDNDLVEATRKMPALQRVATPAFQQGRLALIKAQPVLEFIRPYTPDFVGWLRDFGQSTANYDANGHFARIEPIFNAFSFTDNPAGGVLTPIPPSAKFDGAQTGVQARCPGSGTQRPEDNSAPYTDGGNLGKDDCDPNLVLPGP